MPLYSCFTMAFLYLYFSPLYLSIKYSELDIIRMMGALSVFYVIYNDVFRNLFENIQKIVIKAVCYYIFYCHLWQYIVTVYYHSIAYTLFFRGTFSTSEVPHVGSDVLSISAVAFYEGYREYFIKTVLFLPYLLL